MSRYIAREIRQLVIHRAFQFCEYCLLHESQSFIGFEVDHIISIKHGGSNEASNLAYACHYCNQYKGSDIGTILAASNDYVRFYHPKKDRWLEHFGLEQTLITPKSIYGEATI